MSATRRGGAWRPRPRLLPEPGRRDPPAAAAARRERPGRAGAAALPGCPAVLDTGRHAGPPRLPRLDATRFGDGRTRLDRRPCCWWTRGCRSAGAAAFLLRLPWVRCRLRWTVGASTRWPTLAGPGDDGRLAAANRWSADSASSNWAPAGPLTLPLAGRGRTGRSPSACRWAKSILSVVLGRGSRAGRADPLGRPRGPVGGFGAGAVLLTHGGPGGEVLGPSAFPTAGRRTWRSLERAGRTRPAGWAGTRRARGGREEQVAGGRGWAAVERRQPRRVRRRARDHRFGRPRRRAGPWASCGAWHRVARLTARTGAGHAAARRPPVADAGAASPFTERTALPLHLARDDPYRPMRWARLPRDDRRFPLPEQLFPPIPHGCRRGAGRAAVSAIDPPHGAARRTLEAWHADCPCIRWSGRTNQQRRSNHGPHPSFRRRSAVRSDPRPARTVGPDRGLAGGRRAGRPTASASMSAMSCSWSAMPLPGALVRTPCPMVGGERFRPLPACSFRRRTSLPTASHANVDQRSRRPAGGARACAACACRTAPTWRRPGRGRAPGGARTAQPADGDQDRARTHAG